MKIPPAIRQVFDIFPLQTYKSEAHLEERLSSEGVYPFVCPGSPRLAEKKLNLAVHGVRPISLDSQTTKIIPTDPQSLSSALLLCKKHDLFLPNEQTGSKSVHSLIPISYLASPSKALPMLLETKHDKNDGSNVPLQIGELNLDVGENATCLELMFDEFLDSLNDLWILGVLTDALRVDPSLPQNLFHRDSELRESSILSRQIDLKLFSDLESWNSFSTRHPNLLPRSAVHSNAVLKHVFSVLKNEDALNKAYYNKVAELEKFIPPFMSYLNADHKSNSRDILEIKLVSFMICVEYLLPDNTHLSLTCKKEFDEALKYSKHFLMQF